MIKDANDKLDDYSVSHKIAQILSHWSYELTEKYFFYWLKKLMYKNELLPVSQTRNFAESKRNIRVLFKKQRSNKRKTKK